MTVLSSAQLGDVRRALAEAMARDGNNIQYTKPQINAALQAIEDLFESPAFKNAVSGAIDTATLPVVLTGLQKKRIVAYWLQAKFALERA